MLNEKITRSQAMKDHPHGSFGPKRGARKSPPETVGSTVTKGKNGTTSVDNNNPRLVTPDGKRRRSAKEILPNHTAGPVGKLPDHTVYHDMGMLMAESLGLYSEATKQEGDSEGKRRIPKQMAPVSPYKKRGELAANAAAARGAGRKPAKSPKPDDEATASAMERDTKMLRKRAGATGNESGSA